MAGNGTKNAAEIAVAARLPEGWTDQTAFAGYPLRAGECYPIQEQVTAPVRGKGGWQVLEWMATAGGQPAGSLTIRVFLGQDGGLPQ